MFNPVIHAPARLQIMGVLAGVQDAEFALLRQTVQVSDSVLSKQLAQLAEAGYVKLKKASFEGHLRGWASITAAGKKAFIDHVKALQILANAADQSPSGDNSIG